MQGTVLFIAYPSVFYNTSQSSALVLLCLVTTEELQAVQ